MECVNSFRIKYGTIEVELAGTQEYIAEAVRNVPSMLEVLSRSISGATPVGAICPASASEMAAGQPIEGIDAHDHAPTEVKPLSLVEFLATKDPQDQVEQATCIAYYKEKHEGITEFGPSELCEWWKASRLRVPRNVPDVVARGCQSGVFTRVANRRYRLTRTGDELVERMVSPGTR